MIAPTVAVTCQAADQSGQPVAGAVYTATLNQTEISSGLIAPESVAVVANVSGVATLNLWPNALGTTGSLYRVKATNPENGKKFFDAMVRVPNTACFLHQIIMDEPTPALDSAQQALADAQALLAAGVHYYGALAANPTANPLGGAVVAGDLYFNTVLQYALFYTGTAWERPAFEAAAIDAIDADVLAVDAAKNTAINTTIPGIVSAVDGSRITAQTEITSDKNAVDASRIVAQAAIELAASSAQTQANAASVQALNLAGITSTHLTLAAANAALAGIAANALVGVLADENNQGQGSVYQKVGGTLVYVQYLAYPRKSQNGSDVLTSYPRGSVLCHLGDSNTIATGAWRNAYQQDWLSKGGIFEGWTSYNMGANGQSCAGYAASIASGTQNQAPQDYPNGAGNTNIWQFVNAAPRAVHIRIGTNDFRMGAGPANLAAKVAAFRTNFATIINFLLARTSAKLILSMPPTMCYVAGGSYCDFVSADDAAARNAALRSLHLEWLNVSDRVMVVDTHQYVFGLRVDSVAASADFEGQGSLMSDEIHASLGMLRNAQVISKMVRPSDRYTSALLLAPAPVYDTAVWAATAYGIAATSNVLYLISRNPQALVGPATALKRGSDRAAPLGNIPFAENILLSGGITQTTQICALDFKNCFAYFHNSGNTYAITAGVNIITYRDVNGDIQIGLNGTPFAGESTTNGLITFYVVNPKYIPRYLDKILPINIVLNGSQPLTVGATGVAAPPLGLGRITALSVAGSREALSGVCSVDVYLGNFATGGIRDGADYPGKLLGRYTWPDQYRSSGTWVPNATNYPSGVIDVDYVSSTMFTAICASGTVGKAGMIVLRAY